jgi:hypothetical protein
MGIRIQLQSGTFPSHVHDRWQGMFDDREATSSICVFTLRE